MTRQLLREKDGKRLLTTGEVARLFFRSPKTIATWARTGKLHSERTKGGHHRIYEADAMNLLRGFRS